MLTIAQGGFINMGDKRKFACPSFLSLSIELLTVRSLFNVSVLNWKKVCEILTLHISNTLLQNLLKNLRVLKLLLNLGNDGL